MKTQILLFLFMVVPAAVLAQATNFKGFLTEGDTQTEISGTSDFADYPSLFSVFLEINKGRCGVHLMGQKPASDEAAYIVRAPEGRSARVVCVFDDEEVSERLVAESGSVVLENRQDENRLSGTLEVTLVGGITGRTLDLKGTFSSVKKE